MEKTEFIHLRCSIADKPIVELLELLSSDDLRTRFLA